MSKLNTESNATQWQAESIRLTAFIIDGTYDPKKWWNIVAGQLPETEQSNRNVGLTQMSGTVFDGTYNLTLAILPGRADWIISTLPPSTPEAIRSPSETIGFHTIGNFENILYRFKQLLTPWVETTPNVSRLAFGAVLFLPVQNKEEGYVKISRLLPFIKLDPKGSSEFSYSINRPRKSKIVFDMSINRLSRWAVVQLRPLMFTMTGVVTQLQQAPEFYGCRLEFDVNTQADRQGVLENMPTVIDELIEVGKELAAVGDVP